MSDRPEYFCRKIDEALSELRMKFWDRGAVGEYSDWDLYFTMKSLRIKTMILQKDFGTWRIELPPMPDNDAFSLAATFFSEWDHTSPPHAYEDLSSAAVSALARIKRELVASARTKSAPQAEDLLL